MLRISLSGIGPILKKVPDMHRRADISGLFIAGGQLLAPNETQEHLILHKKGKAPLRDIFGTRSGAMIVSENLRLLMEELDPGCHQFLSLSIDNRPDAAPRYILNVHATKDSVIDDQSDVKPNPLSTGRDNMYFSYNSYDKGPRNIAFSAAALDGPHAWRERRYRHSLLISDAFATAINERQLRIFPMRQARKS